jgi:hypothetical protein
MILLGMQPGITMVEQRLDLVYTIIWSLAIANVLGAALCILISPGVARLTTLPYVYVAPFMLMIIFFASFQATTDWGDILTLLGIGVLGIYMRRFGWPRPPLLIGFVLAKGAETYLYQAIQFYEWSWLWRPGVLTIAAFTLISVWAGSRYGRSTIDEGGESGKVRDIRPQLVFGGFVAIAFAYGVYDSLKQSYLAQLFPLGLSIISLAVAVGVLALVKWGPSTSKLVFDTEADTPPDRPSMEHYLAWMLGLMALSALVGFVIGLGLFFLIFLHVKARAPLLRNLLLSASAMLFLAAMSYIFVMDFPGGVLQAYVDMPWPFR